MFDEAAEYSTAHSAQLAVDENSRLLTRLAGLIKVELTLPSSPIFNLQ